MDNPDISATTQELNRLQCYVGRAEKRDENIDPERVIRLAAALDSEGHLFATHGELALPLHWIYHLPSTATKDLAEDGHPLRGGLVPSVPNARRMWASSRILANGPPMKLNSRILKESTISNIRQKRGTSGNLLFVSVEHRLSSEAGIHLTELQEIVFRERAPTSGQSTGPLARRDEKWSRVVTATPLLLFRYSALTFNSHRIHYDRPYATNCEGYPGLVVHGPLVATLLLDLAYRATPGRRAIAFSFRAVRPLFDGRPFHLCAAPLPQGDGLSLWARDEAGFLATEASVEFAAPNC